MDNKEILTRRLTNQRLIGSKFKSVKEAVGWFCGIQSQDYPNARWGLGQRVENTTDLSIQKAYDEGIILRTHVMRPTWHFVLPQDVVWMLELTAPRIKRILTTYNKALELDESIFEKSCKIISERLKGNNFATRKELAMTLSGEGIKASGQRLGHIVSWAELDGIICSGPMRGRQFTYALISERAPKALHLTREQSLQELAKRYFASHGPACTKDFSWWSGLTMKEALLGIEMNVDLLSFEDNKTPYYYFDTKVEKITNQAYLLPNYDEYGIAYQNRIHFHNPENDKYLGVRGNANFQHLLILNGHGAGTWRKILKKDTVIVEVAPFTTFSIEEKIQIEKTVEKYGKFLSLKPILQL